MTIVSYRPPESGKIFPSEEPDQPLENSVCLSNGRMVKILEGEIETKAMELPLKIFEMKRYMHYNANIAHFFIGGVTIISWDFLSKYLLSTYSHDCSSLERNSEYCYREFDVPEITQPSRIIEYTSIAYLLKNVSNICSIQKQLRRQRQQFKSTKEKICALIEKLNQLDPADPLLASSLPSYASEIDFCPESFEAMIDRMNFNQIKNLQGSLGEKFDSILKTRVLNAFFPYR